MDRKFILLVLLFYGLIPMATAVELVGVRVPERIQPAGMSQQLYLNGAGIRSKFIFDIYVAGLYLPDKQRDAVAIMDDPPASRILMHFVYKQVSREKLDAGWKEGFVNNSDVTQVAALATRLQAFSDMFTDMMKNDEVWLDYFPGNGTRVTINGSVMGLVPGADFNAALLSVWLGEEPVTIPLKKALLGAEKH